MKIKGFIITGLIFSVVGVSLIVVGATRDDFNIIPETETLEFENTVSKINYSSSFDDLEVVYGDVEKITIISKKSEYMTYEISKDNDIITINQNWTKEWYQFPIHITTVPFKITIPQDTEMSLDLSMDAGNIEVKGIKGSTLTAKINAGNLTTKDIEFDNCNVDIDLGNMTVEALSISNLTLDMKSGNVDYSGKILTRGDFSVDAGNINAKLSQSKSLFTEKINDKVDGNGSIIINLDCKAGNITTRYEG